MSFRYITKEDKSKELFYKIPKQFMLEEKYKKMKDSAKILYSILFERTNLSIENNWFDNNDRAYIICTFDEIQTFFGCSRDKVNNALKDLEKFDLIKKDKIKSLNGDMVNVLYIAHVETTNDTLKTLMEKHLNEYHTLSNKNKEYKREYNKKQSAIKKENRDSRLVQSENQTTIENTNFQKLKIVKPSNFNGSPKIRLRAVRKSDYRNTDFRNTDKISMYVSSENSQIEKNRTFIDRFKELLEPSSYALNTIPLFENKIEYDLFDKVLVDAINNSKKENKENYIISKLNKLIQRGIVTLDKYLEESFVFNYKNYVSKKSNMNFTEKEIREMYAIDKAISQEVINSDDNWDWN